MDNQTIYIPPNFTDAGKLLGLFPVRHMIECAVLCVPIICLLTALSPFSFTGTIILCATVSVPLGGFALMGIQDGSLLVFVRMYYTFRKRRRIMIYRGNTWIKRKNPLRISKQY